MTALVQHATNGTTANQATVAVTIAASTAGNHIIVGAGNNGGLTVTGVTDNATGGSNVYSQIAGAQSDRDGGAGGKGDVWASLSTPRGGATTVTITFSSATTNVKVGFVDEVSGLVGASLDVAAVVNQQTTGTTDSGASVTTSSTDGFVFGLCITGNGITANPAAGNEFTAGGDIESVISLWAACSLISTTAAAHQPKWTDTAGQNFCASTVAFKAAAGGSGLGIGPFQIHGVGAGPIARKRLTQRFPDTTAFPPPPPPPVTFPLGRIHPGMGGPAARFRIPQRYPAGANAVTPTAGILTITGQVASTILTIAAIAGAIVISGNAPSLSTILQPAEAPVIFGGNAPSISIGTILAPTEGSVVIGGVAPSLSTTLSPTEGSVVIGGNPPSLTNQLQATEGAVVIGGNVPSVTQTGGSNLTPTEGLLTIGGQAPSLAFTLVPSEGLLQFIGNTPDLGPTPPTVIIYGSSGGHGKWKHRKRVPSSHRELAGILDRIFDPQGQSEPPPPTVVAAADAVVQPYAQPLVDLYALARDLEAVRALKSLLRESAQREDSDDDDDEMLMLS
jgi:hypothetical protein